MAAYLALDSAASVPPVIGWVVDTLFPGHLMAANALQKDIEARHGPSALPPSLGPQAQAAQGACGFAPEVGSEVTPSGAVIE